jgi:hypothetical protein
MQSQGETNAKMIGLLNQSHLMSTNCMSCRIFHLIYRLILYIALSSAAPWLACTL